MSPINSNGSKLEVITVVGGSVLLNEEAGRYNYGQNQQREKTRKAGTHPMDVKAFGHTQPPLPEEPEAAPVDEKLADAIDKDLASRNLPKKSRKPRAKKQTTKTTDKE